MLMKMRQDIKKSKEPKFKTLEALDRPHIIIVEGSDDATFLEKFCEFHKINTSDIELHVIDGCEKVNKHLQYIKLILEKEQGEKLKSISIIFDADGSFEQKKESIESAFKNITQDMTKKIYLFPNNKDKGILEDIILSNEVFFSDEIKQNVNDFFCIVKKTDEKEKFPLNEYLAKDPHVKSMMGAVFTARFKDARGLVGLFSVLKQQNKTDEFLKNISSTYSEPLLEFLQNIPAYDTILSQ